MLRTRIIGTGSYLPDRILLNQDVGMRLGLDTERMSRLTGISERRWAAPSQSSSDLAVEASLKALDAAATSPSSVDAILVSTTSPDSIFPSTACHVQRKLGCRGVAAFDVAASCSGFLYALSMADAMIRSGQAGCCLVVAAEVKSRVLDPDDADTAFLFGDGAGAVVLRGDEALGQPDHGILRIRLYADGGRHDLIRIPAGGSRQPVTEDAVHARRHMMRMQGAPLFRLAVKKLDGAIRDILKEFGMRLEDVAQFILHQANGRILTHLIERLGVAPSSVCSVIERYGNTSSASLPIALDHAARKGTIRDDDVILLGSFGGGLTWAAGLVRW